MSNSFSVHVTKLAVLVGGVTLWPVVMGASAVAEPTAIRLTVAAPPVKVGSTVPLVLEFLDGKFQPVKNDRNRTVRLDVLNTGGMKQGQGQLTPTYVKVLAGQAMVSTVRFTAKAPGTVLVRATTEGLAPGEAVVPIILHSSALMRLVFPTVSAQEPRSFELLPRTHEPFPLNRKTTAQFSIFVDAPAPSGTRVSYRVDTDPAVPIIHGEQRSIGSAIVEMDGGQYQTRPIYVLPASRPGQIRIRAQRLPGGPSDDVVVEFVPPQPVSVSFEHESYRAKADDRVVPLNVVLLDKDGIPLEELAEPRDIKLASASGSSADFEPPTITLSRGHAGGTSYLHLPWLRFGRDLKVLAEEQTLKTGEAAITVTATELALLLVAILAGFLGGVARHVYLVRTANLLPTRTRGRIDPGLIGNALLSALCGVVLFKAIDLSILHGVDRLAAVHDTAALGFVLGAAGGFAGILVFEALVERLLSKKVTAEVG
jgi:hypothetical protein